MFGERFFHWLDARAALGIDVWEFSARSLARAYGRVFLRTVMFRYPRRTWAGLREYARHVRPGRRADLAWVGAPPDPKAWAEELAGQEWVVGMGFCQKDLACPVGRFNHRCLLLERFLEPDWPAVCEKCPVRQVALHALPAGAGLHLMTSAEDIAGDLLLPGLERRVPNRWVLVICPYSIAPISLAMVISGLRGWLLAYHQGDCRDYATWLKADTGTKPEQTALPAGSQTRLLELLERVAAARTARGLASPQTFRAAGNLFLPAGESG